MKVGDLVQEVLASGIPRRNLLGRVGIVMEATEMELGGGDRDIMGMVLWTGNTDWEIIYPEDIIIISQVAS